MVGGLLTDRSNMRNKNLLQYLILFIFIGLDYAYMNIYYSFTIFGYFAMHYLETKNQKKHSIFHYLFDFVILPITFKIILINLLHFL